jgi:hypothetical protein
LNNGFIVELLFIPSVPDNVMSWRVFNDNSHIISFLTNVDMFQGFVIDDEEHQQELQKYRDEANKIKSNCISRNVLTLKKLFDL